MQEVYVTRYALTRGILQYRSVDGHNIQVRGAYVCIITNNGLCLLFKEWSPDLSGAKKIAEKMCERKIVNLKRQISKLEKLISSFQSNA
jgi:hypothetical protein